MQIICTRCGRTIDGEFIFCPWCGINRFNSVYFPAAPLIHEAKETGGAKLSKTARSEKITNMARALDALEKDLAALALNEDRHT
jgi:predicted  nucleic acid-binding Zn-ribbon protein